MTFVFEQFLPPEAALGARLYAALHRGNQGDVEFYVRACRGRRRLRILELGCGALRMTLVLARAGHAVTGVELDRALYTLALSRLEQEQFLGKGSVELVHADMLEYRSDVVFDKVLIPYSAFWCLPSIEHKRACLELVSRHLAPAGELILDAYSSDHLREQSKGRKRTVEPIIDEFELTEHVAELGEDRYRVFERNSWWPSQKHTRVEYALEAVNVPGERWRMVLDHHYLWRHELAELLDQAGFETEWGADDAATGSAFEQQIVVRGHKL